jgi:hypothetical protein
MSDTRESTLVDLPSAVTAPHDRALAGLDGGPSGAADAVAWLSAHLAACDCVLHAAVRKALPAGRRRVRELRDGDHLLQQALCRLDRRLTGDVHLAGVPLQEFVDDVRDRLADHVAREGRAVDELTTRLSPDDQRALAQRLGSAMAAAPTRPHPHTPHTPMAALVAHVDAFVDRARDLMDNRTAPTPCAVRAPRAPGRWGSYLMGVPYPAQDRREG